MASESIETKGTAVVAVGFDDQTDGLIASAVALARRFDLALRFVHVVPLQTDLAIDYSAAIYAYPLAVLPTEAEDLATAAGRMQEALAKVPAGVKKTATVVAGQPVAIIVAEAVACRATLILASCDPQGYSTLSDNFSTTIQLMQEAPLPVLVVAAKPLAFAKERFQLLVADDLEQTTEQAAAKAYELAAKLGPATAVRHVHVHGDFREAMHDAWQTSWQEAKALLPSRAPAESFDVAFERLTEGRQLRIAGRGQPWRSKAEAAGTAVTIDLRTGNVAKELQKAIADAAPDLVVFGRHRFLRTKPFLLGRVPFRTMLQAKCAVLLVPPAQELYARIGFPCA